MKRLAVEQGNVSLRQAARLAKRGLVVLTERGRPITALVDVGDDLALEAFALSRNKAFMAYLDACAASVSAGRGVSIELVRNEFGLSNRRRLRGIGARASASKRRR